jgi:methylated-DNA-[protein]-cysteine S-methyltransferase
MCFRTKIETALGDIVIETTSKGVRSVRFASSVPENDCLNRNPRAQARAADAIKELSLYFDRKLKVFSVSVDLSWASPFSRAVYTALMQVPFGGTISYAELAAAAGRPGGARAVGRAMAENQAPIIIPCHRVIASDGRIGGWSGPEGLKDRLHALEGIRTR